MCCKSSWNQLQDLCRLAKLSCPALGISKRNLYDFEVEYLCDYKKIRVSLGDRGQGRGVSRKLAYCPLAPTPTACICFQREFSPLVLKN